MSRLTCSISVSLDGLGDDPPELELTRVVESPSGVAHLRYAVG